MGSKLPLALAVVAALCCGAYAQCSRTAAPGGSCGAGVCCSNGQCCSKFGFCGISDGHCGAGCQSAFGRCAGGAAGPPTRPTPPSTPVSPSAPSGGLSSMISPQMWEEMFPIRNKPPCQGAASSFYSRQAFLQAAASFPAFATSSDATTHRRELAAFLAHISQETTGGGDTGGLCWIIEGANNGPPADRYCQPGQFPCASGKSYHGRGPIQLSWNYNYIPAGRALGFDGLNNPDAVARDPVLAFKTALWFWMTLQAPKPSAHDVMTGRWTPSAADAAAGRAPGFGMVTNVINGGIECGKGSPSDKEAGRVRYFTRYARMLGVSTGPNTSCANQRAFR